MIVKAPRKINVKKLRAILLIEADLNGLHEIIFNTRVLPQIEEDYRTSQEIIGTRAS